MPLQRHNGTMIARLLALVFGLVLASTFLARPASAIAEPAANQGPHRIFVLDAPFLEWSDITPETMPNLHAILESSGLANAVMRSTLRIDGETITPDEAMASLATGYWVAEPADLVTNPIPLPAAPASEMELASESVTFKSGRVLPGVTADLFEKHGWTLVSAGCSDTRGTAVRPAAVYASNGEGIAQISDTQPEHLLSSSPDWPFGVRTDLAYLERWLDAALESCPGNALVALDSGDLYRAGVYRLDKPEIGGNVAWTRALASLDAVVGMAVERMGSGDCLVLVSPLSKATSPDHADDSYAPVIVYGGGLRGMLGSGTTGRAGLLTSGDLFVTILGLGGIVAQPIELGAAATVSPGTETMPATSIVASLDRETSAADAINDGQNSMNFVLAILLALSFGCSVIMLSTRIRLRMHALDLLIPTTRILWVMASAYPLATNLVGLFLGSGSTALQAIATCSALTLALAFAALVFGRFTRWIYSIVLLMLLTVVVLSIDQLTGGNLAHLGFLTYRPIVSPRYYGIGNEGAACLFGAWLMLSGLLLNRFPDLKIAKAFRTWLFPLLTLVIIAIIVAPWWGANFGVLVWGFVGGGCAWWMFTGRRLTWKVVLVAIAASGALLIGLVLVDGLFSSSSHLGSMASTLIEQGIAYIPAVLTGMIPYFLDTIFYSPVLTIALVFIWIYLAYLRIGKPGPYKVFWNRNWYFKSAFTAAMVIAVIMILIEDSGILLPALVLIYSTAGLTWMISDLHRWELRAREHEQGIIPDDVEKPIGGFKVED